MDNLFAIVDVNSGVSYIGVKHYDTLSWSKKKA